MYNQINNLIVYNQVIHKLIVDDKDTIIALANILNDDNLLTEYPVEIITKFLKLSINLVNRVGELENLLID